MPKPGPGFKSYVRLAEHKLKAEHTKDQLAFFLPPAFNADKERRGTDGGMRREREKGEGRMDGWMAVEYEKQEQRLVASQVRNVRGHRGRRGREGRGGWGTEPKKGSNDNKQEKS